VLTPSFSHPGCEPPSLPLRFHNQEIRLSHFEDGDWFASSTIGGILVQGGMATNPWAAIGEMLTSYLNWYEFYRQGNSEGAARAIWGDGLVQTGEDDEGAFVEFFCGVQWNRIYWADEANAESMAKALRRFHDYKLARDQI
jgi:hypothetical protein